MTPFVANLGVQVGMLRIETGHQGFEHLHQPPIEQRHAGRCLGVRREARRSGRLQHELRGLPGHTERLKVVRNSICAGNGAVPLPAGCMLRLTSEAAGAG